MNRDIALEIARELDRRALLHDSRGDCALTEQELAATVEAILSARVHQTDDGRVTETRERQRRRKTSKWDAHGRSMINDIDHLLSLLPQLSSSEAADRYARRLLSHLAPRVEPLPTLLGVLTQIDNWSVDHKGCTTAFPIPVAEGEPLAELDKRINANVARMEESRKVSQAELSKLEFSTPTAAPVVEMTDGATERKCVLELIERFQREPKRSKGTVNALEWLRRQIVEGNHVYHTFETATQGFSETDQCARCGLLPNALMHLLADKPSTVISSEAAKEAAREIARWMNMIVRLPESVVEQNVISIEGMLRKYFPPTGDAVPINALVQLLLAALERPESAEGYIRQVIETLQAFPPTEATLPAGEALNNKLDGMSDTQITQRVADMRARLDKCAQAGQAYRLKWHEVKLIIATIQTLQERLAAANDFNNDVVEREAAVCPEDVGFDEYIRSLETNITTAREKAIGEVRDIIEAKQTEWEKLGDYGINREYLNRIEGSNDILDALQALVQKPAGDPVE